MKIRDKKILITYMEEKLQLSPLDAKNKFCKLSKVKQNKLLQEFIDLPKIIQNKFYKKSKQGERNAELP